MGDARFVWVDLEMTGLDPERCVIVELAMIITDSKLTPLCELERAIWQPEEELARTTPFVRDMHTKNGLFEKVRASAHSLADVEKEALALLVQHTKFREGMLAGNSIWQDRRFMCRHMPLFEQFLHYRQVDVSSLKVLAGTWASSTAHFDKASKSHTALDDIRGSLAELAHYRQHFLRVSP